MSKRIVIIGAGPAGLGAGYRLSEIGCRDWQIYEKNSYVGGLAASFKDEHGFIWDIGGHVIHSHYEYFSKLVKKLLGDDYLEHIRNSWICLDDGTFIPYPFQDNIRFLKRNKFLECLSGLIKARVREKSSRNFGEWIFNTFGQGIAEYFMIPYNLKAWVYPLELMDTRWIADRIKTPALKELLRSIFFKKANSSWGPNSRFIFPLFGGTGNLFNKFRPSIEKNLFLNKEVVEVDPNQKKIKFINGEVIKYDLLINTSPLDEFIKSITIKDKGLLEAAAQLKFTSGFIVGIGLKKECPSKKCWIYFPEGNCPFYRVTYISNYSPNNTPGDDYSSLLCETSYSTYKPEKRDNIIEKTVEGLINNKLLSIEDKKRIVSTYLIEVERTYAIPTLGRDEALNFIQSYLGKNDIYSRGRFGAWRYELGNMDHSVMQGVQIVNQLNETQGIVD